MLQAVDVLCLHLSFQLLVDLDKGPWSFKEKVVVELHEGGPISESGQYLRAGRDPTLAYQRNFTCQGAFSGQVEFGFLYFIK